MKKSYRPPISAQPGFVHNAFDEETDEKIMTSESIPS